MMRSQVKFHIEIIGEKEVFTIWTDNEELNIKLEQDMLIGLMSRKIPYAINTNGKKVFMIRFWIDGPYDTRSNY